MLVKVITFLCYNLVFSKPQTFRVTNVFGLVKVIKFCVII